MENSFIFNPFEVGNPMTLGLMEEQLEKEVRDMVENLKYRYGLCVPSYIVTEEMQKRGIPYMQLPKYMKDIIDELDVYA